MLSLRHLRHPFRSAMYVFQWIHSYFYNRLAERHFRKIRRGYRDTCWCGGELLPFVWHKSYGVCAKCGCYVNRYPPLNTELKKLYSLDLYWRLRQKMRGAPTIEDRSALYRSDGRLDRWLHLIEQYCPAKGLVIEVGCAPGVLIHELSQRGYECIGVEISDDVAESMRNTLKLDVRAGFFPGVSLPHCLIFLAFDVLEHTPCPEDFMREVSRLLLPGGIAIIQTGINRYDYEPPFGERFGLFDDVEHLFLFTDQAMQELAARVGLEIINKKESLWIGGELCILRKP